MLACGAGGLVDHLLFSEIRTQPTSGEAIEIYNPTLASVDLSDYRIYNATFISPDGLSDCRYYNHAALPDGGTCGAAFTDFDIQFPAGATIGAGQVKVIALTGANVYCDAGNCGAGQPDFEIPPNDGGANASVPDMRGVWDPFAGNGYLTNLAEDLIFYKWNGVAGTNVQDVDYFIYGTGLRTSKTGVGTYLPDTAIALQFVMDGGTSATTTYQRGCYNENGELKTAGNGITGHNETSEHHNENWFIGPPSLGAKTPGSTP